MTELTLLQDWEVLAVVLAVAYLVLAIRQNIWCWAAAAVSTVLYLFIMYHSRLYMESLLQLFYLAMAVYGLYSWSHPAKGTASKVPVDAPDGTDARPIFPESRITSTSTVGLPLESRISLALTTLMRDIRPHLKCLLG